MTDWTEAAGAHPADGDLVRLLDGEGAGRDLERHLEACDDCRRRYRRIASWSRDVGRALDAADPVVGERAERDRAPDAAGAGVPRWAKVAAGVVLLLAAALALQPVRAWVVDRVERVVRRLGFVEPPPPPAGAGGGASVSFVAEGRRLRIRVEEPQSEGELEVTTARTDGQVRASVVAGGGAGAGPSPAFAAFPSELRIRNAPGSRASYRVTVPASLDALEIRVGDLRLARLAGGELSPGAAPRTWPLRAPDGGGGEGPEND